MTTTTLDNRMRVSGRITRIETISQTGTAMAASLRSAGLIGDSPDVTAVYVDGVPVLFDESAESWPTIRRALGSGISSMEAYGEYMSANLASVRLPGASSCLPSPDFVLFPHRDRTGNPALGLDLVITGRNIEDRPRTREVGSPGHCLTCDDLVLRTDVRAVALAHGEHRTDVADDGSIGRCTRCFEEVLRVDADTQAERDFVTTAAHRMGVVSVGTLEYGVPAPVLVHWARHNGQVGSCGVLRSEAWLAEQGRRPSDKTAISRRQRLERELFGEDIRVVHRFTHGRPQLVNCRQCRHEMERSMLVGLQTGVGHQRCDGSCERRGVHTAYHAFECPRCEPVRIDGWPMYFGDPLPIPNLLNSEGQDLAILPHHYPGLPALV